MQTYYLPRRQPSSKLCFFLTGNDLITEKILGNPLFLLISLLWSMHNVSKVKKGNITTNQNLVLLQTRKAMYLSEWYTYLLFHGGGVYAAFHNAL